MDVIIISCYFDFMITYHLITLFPESFESYLNASIVKRAKEKGKIAIKYYNPRDFTAASKKGAEQTYADRRVDNRPYGGGPGMVIEALPVIKAIEKAVGNPTSLKLRRTRKIKSKKQKEKIKSESKKGISRDRVLIIFFSPAGELFTNDMAETYKKYTDIVMVCGRYEGIDARIKKAFPMVDISVGPYVLTGGELPAMVMIDCITRRISGVLGHDSSIEESRVSSSDVYTRPEVITYKGKKLRVPKVLLNGDHKKIEDWKLRGKLGK